MIRLSPLKSNRSVVSIASVSFQKMSRPRSMVCVSYIFFLAFAFHALEGSAQSPSPSAQQLPPVSAAPTAPRGGSATAGVFAPVLDSEKRPITAGGFVKDGPVIFKDIAQQAGLATW